MRRSGISAAVAAVAVLASLLTAPAAPAATGGAPYEPSEPVTYIVPTRHGDLYMEVIHPTKGGEVVKAPVILTMSPYSVLGRNGDADRWVPRGYARAWVDVVGTGNSGGCYDYGGKREKETGFDTVEWIAKQKWSTGKTGMIGGSYNGTTATATAVMRPPHLTTIVPEAAISRWYGYAYSGGIRYSLNNEFLGHEGPRAIIDEGLDTPLLFDFGFALPPPVDPQNENWAERVQSTITPCDEVEHTMRGYNLDEPTYDEFWLERDYVKDAPKVRIPVLVAHNWGDWNVKQEHAWHLFRALKNSKQRVLYMGSRWDRHTTPGGDYAEFVDKWMDHHLMGKKNGIDRAPEVISQTADSDGPGAWKKGMPKTRNVSLYVQQFTFVGPGEYEWRVFPMKPGLGGDAIGYPMTGANLETHANHHGGANHEWYWLEGAPLRQDTRVFGEIKIQIYSKADRRWITMTPSVVDYNHACHQYVGSLHVLKPECGTTPLVSVTRGFLDSRYRDSLAKPKDVEPNKYFPMTVPAKPIDYVFKKGHSISLQLQSEAIEWMIPKFYPGGCENPTEGDPQNCVRVHIDWASAKTRMIVPIVGAPKNPRKLFCIPGDQAAVCRHMNH